MNGGSKLVLEVARVAMTDGVYGLVQVGGFAFVHDAQRHLGEIALDQPQAAERVMQPRVEAGALPGPPGSSAGVRTMLLRRAQHPDAARAFVSYLDEQSAQAAASAH